MSNGKVCCECGHCNGSSIISISHFAQHAGHSDTAQAASVLDAVVLREMDNVPLGLSLRELLTDPAAVSSVALSKRRIQQEHVVVEEDKEEEYEQMMETASWLLSRGALRQVDANIPAAKRPRHAQPQEQKASGMTGTYATAALAILRRYRCRMTPGAPPPLGPNLPCSAHAVAWIGTAICRLQF